MITDVTGKATDRSFGSKTIPVYVNLSHVTLVNSLTSLASVVLIKVRNIPPRALQRTQQVEKLAKDAFGKQIDVKNKLACPASSQ